MQKTGQQAIKIQYLIPTDGGSLRELSGEMYNMAASKTPIWMGNGPWFLTGRVWIGGRSSEVQTFIYMHRKLPAA